MSHKLALVELQSINIYKMRVYVHTHFGGRRSDKGSVHFTAIVYKKNDYAD